MDDMVFKALNDPSRRLLLDALFDEDGQSLGALCHLLPSMTRYGVMNHLSILESAGLVTTRKSGRRKLHYLNPIPIRLVHERWITKYTERKAQAMTQLKSELEAPQDDEDPDHVYQVIINAPPETTWNAIVSGDVTEKYFYGTRVESTWEVGASITYSYPDGSIAAEGSILRIDPGSLLERSFLPKWDPELEAEGPAREIWTVEAFNGASRLTVELYDTPPGSKMLTEFAPGYAYIVSGMKTLLETGNSLPDTPKTRFQKAE